MNSVRNFSAGQLEVRRFMIGRTLVGSVASLALIAGCTGGDSPGTEPTPAPLTQAEARAEIPINGVEGTSIQWRTDTEPTPGDPVDVVKTLTAIGVVGDTYDPPLDPRLIAPFVGAMNASWVQDLTEDLDPAGADAERWGPIVGDVRAWVREVHRGPSSAVDDYPNFPGPFVIVAVCLDPSERVVIEHPAQDIGGASSRFYMLQEVGEGGAWVVQDNNALSSEAVEAQGDVVAECDDWIPDEQS